MGHEKIFNFQTLQEMCWQVFLLYLCISVYGPQRKKGWANICMNLTFSPLFSPLSSTFVKNEHYSPAHMHVTLSQRAQDLSLSYFLVWPATTKVQGLFCVQHTDHKVTMFNLALHIVCLCSDANPAEEEFTDVQPLGHYWPKWRPWEVWTQGWT